MKRIRIVHKTEYHYREPVSFGPHRVMMRPREGHDVHIVRGRLDVEPAATVRWLHDIYSNSIALLTFSQPSRTLSVVGEVDVDLHDDNPIACLIDPNARQFPFQYAPEEQVELISCRLPSYPYEGAKLQQWLGELYRPGQVVGTFELLEKLNTHIFQSFKYAHRDDPGVQLPCDTLARGSGSCRDFAVLMMEAARHWGFAARFVTGYIQMNEGQHGATHAWTDIYIPGAGWHGFDPTNNKLAGNEHIAVAVAREQERASPLSGTWDGPANAFQDMNVSVQVSAI
jgi:transglutaminase-like putative cysteine protease